MARVSNEDILAAITQLAQDQSEELAAIRTQVTQLNGTVRNHDKRVVVLEDHDAQHCKAIETLQERERNLSLQQAKSAAGGAVVGSVIGYLIQAIPNIISALK